MFISHAPTSDDLVHLFKFFYFLNEKDAKTIMRLMDYMLGKGQLPPKELEKWLKIGIIDLKTKKVNVPFIYKDSSLIYPAYWINCLLMYRGF